MTRLMIALLTIAVAAPTGDASAQGLRDEVLNLFRFGGSGCSEILCLPGLGGEHGNHFIPAVEEGGGSIINFLTQAISVNINRVPTPSASGGLAFRFQNGVPIPVSYSGGPIYAERAETLGKGRLLIGASTSLSRFSTIRGVPLDNLLFNFRHQDVAPTDSLGRLGDPTFENDLIQVRAALDVDLLVIPLFVTYGLVDGLDIGLTVPFVFVSVSGTGVANIIPLGAGIFSPVHRFGGTLADPVLVAESGVNGSAQGIGDVTARLKFGLGTGPGGGCGSPEDPDAICGGVLGEVRFPTGDENDLLGSGDYTVRALLNLSGRIGYTFSPHINVGFLKRFAELESDAVLATVGFDQLIGSRFTVAVDVLSEWEVGDGPQLPGDIVYVNPFPRSLPSTTIPDQRENIVNASVGLRVPVSNRTTILLNTLIPLTDDGMLPEVLWLGGVQLTF